jgi:broad-specificity NMP kinase
MITEVDEKNIQEVWKVTDLRPENSKHSHFVIVIDSASYLCSCLSSISRGIVCRHYFQVMLHSKIAGFHIQMIPSRWYTNEKRDNNVVTEAFCFANQNAAENCPDRIITPNPSTVPKTVTNVLRLAAQRKQKYGEVWGLARQAAQLAIEHNNHSEMIIWLRKFIGQHKEVVPTLQNQDQPPGNNQVDYADADKENEFEQVENPLVSRRKGRPETKRYKSATEQKGKPRAKYTCSTCGHSGHNSARCQS